ncbi:MAG: MBL fold metallo-hydrolase [Dehalococcoidia bacterium]|nr:MBL fold metallo-hydrolase [Dehalococcoidia bacterium]
MEITWLGHSCFKIRGKQAAIVTDPYGTDIGYALGKPTANIVTVSHNHKDHNNTADVLGEPRVVSHPGEYEIAGVLIFGLSTPRNAEKDILRGKNTIFVFETEEITLCHLGNLDAPLSDSQIEEIGKVDVLMIPVGGNYTLKPAEAAALVRRLDPRIVLPMHYKSPYLTNDDLEPVDNFLREYGVSDLAPLPKISFNKNNLPPVTQVTLLEAQPGK